MANINLLVGHPMRWVNVPGIWERLPTILGKITHAGGKYANGIWVDGYIAQLIIGRSSQAVVGIPV
jgi:hypothetical protein